VPEGNPLTPYGVPIAAMYPRFYIAALGSGLHLLAEPRRLRLGTTNNTESRETALEIKFATRQGWPMLHNFADEVRYELGASFLREHVADERLAATAEILYVVAADPADMATAALPVIYIEIKVENPAAESARVAYELRTRHGFDGYLGQYETYEVSELSAPGAVGIRNGQEVSEVALFCPDGYEDVSLRRGGSGGAEALTFHAELGPGESATRLFCLTAVRHTEALHESTAEGQPVRPFVHEYRRRVADVEPARVLERYSAVLEANAALERRLTLLPPAVQEVTFVSLACWRANTWYVLDPDSGEKLFLQSEYMEKPGFYNTMDVIYNSSSFLLLTNPGLLRMQLQHALDYNEPGIRYIQHDIGRTGEGALDNHLTRYSTYHREWRMWPMDAENTANFLLLLHACVYSSSDASLPRDRWDEVTALAEFLAECDTDGDGYLEEHTSTTFDCGFVDSSTYISIKVAAAYLATAALADRLGKADEAALWRNKGEGAFAAIVRTGWRDDGFILAKGDEDHCSTQTLNALLYPLLTGLSIPLERKKVSIELERAKAIPPNRHTMRMNDFQGVTWISQIMWFGIIDRLTNPGSDWIERAAKHYLAFLHGPHVDDVAPFEAIDTDGSRALQCGYSRPVCAAALLWALEREGQNT